MDKSFFISQSTSLTLVIVISLIFVFLGLYNSKKYLIPCERRFEINSEDIVIGFVSNGCF